MNDVIDIKTRRIDWGAAEQMLINNLTTQLFQTENRMQSRSDMRTFACRAASTWIEYVPHGN